jgi:hypothetical protein
VLAKATDKTGAIAHKASPTREHSSENSSQCEPSQRPKRLLTTLINRGTLSHQALRAKHRKYRLTTSHD